MKLKYIIGLLILSCILLVSGCIELSDDFHIMNDTNESDYNTYILTFNNIPYPKDEFGLEFYHTFKYYGEGEVKTDREIREYIKEWKQSHPITYITGRQYQYFYVYSNFDSYPKHNVTSFISDISKENIEFYICNHYDDNWGGIYSNKYGDYIIIFPTSDNTYIGMNNMGIIDQNISYVEGNFYVGRDYKSYTIYDIEDMPTI